MAKPLELLTYVNGRVMPHSQAIPLLQRINATSVGGYYDNERTFGGKVFQLRSHLDRLYSGLKASQITPSVTLEELERITLGIIDANAPYCENGGELTVTQIINISKPQSADDAITINIVVYCQPLDSTHFARSYIHGVQIITPDTYGVSRGQLEIEPQNQKGNRLQLFRLMSNSDGSITECQGANFMFVKDKRIKLPNRRNVLPGVSMQTALGLAESLNIPIDEGSYIQRDLYSADEAFISSTRFCILPVATINGMRLGDPVPGTITTALLEAWRSKVGIDFVRQALSQLPP